MVFVVILTGCVIIVDPSAILDFRLRSFDNNLSSVVTLIVHVVDIRSAVCSVKKIFVDIESAVKRLWTFSKPPWFMQLYCYSSPYKFIHHNHCLIGLQQHYFQYFICTSIKCSL